MLLSKYYPLVRLLFMGGVSYLDKRSWVLDSRQHSQQPVRDGSIHPRLFSTHVSTYKDSEGRERRKEGKKEREVENRLSGFSLLLLVVSALVFPSLLFSFPNFYESPKNMKVYLWITSACSHPP